MNDADWLAGFPDGWRELRADFLCYRYRETVSPERFEGKLVAHYSIPQVQETGGPLVEPADDIDSTKLRIRQPTLLVSKLNPRKKTICIAEPQGDFPTLASGEFVPIQSDKFDQRYAFYIWASDKVTDRLSAIVQSTTRSHQRVNPADILKLPWKWPSLETQKKIAAFLDEKTAQIDALIARKRALLERLAEERQAIFTQAVTKGLNPAVPMKDSGIEWLGQIPKHWEMKRLRFVGRSQNGINIGGEFFGFGYPFVSYGDVYNNYALPGEVVGLVESSAEDRKRYSVKRGDIFFTRTSETIEEIGFSSVCLEGIEDACFAGFLIRVRPWTDTLIPEFSKYYFRQTGLRAFLVKEMNLVTRASLSQTLLGNLPVLLPPLSEQKEIANQTTSAMSQIDAITSRCSTSVNQLSEYRSALITAAVTGQIGGLR